VRRAPRSRDPDRPAASADGAPKVIDQGKSADGAPKVVDQGKNADGAPKVVDQGKNADTGKPSGDVVHTSPPPANDTCAAALPLAFVAGVAAAAGDTRTAFDDVNLGTPSCVKSFSTTKPTSNKAVNALVDAEVLVETTGRRRDRTFGYAADLNRLRAGTEI
jgi:hypothetical protein